jgi:hypothetical protein
MLSGLHKLRDSAVEAALRNLAAGPTVVNHSVAIKPEELSGVKVRWPMTYQWPTARLWVDTILYGLKDRVAVEFRELPQPYRGTILFQFVRHGKAHDVAIDYSDYPEVNKDSAARCDLYFKMQYLREGYGRENIVAGGYVCDSRKIYLHLAQLRRLRDRRQFEFDVCGRFSTEFARETRRRAVKLLSNQDSFRFEGGLKKVKYLDFLKEVARAKVCIDLPGEGDLCFRLVNYLAVGACVVGPRPRTTLHAPLVDGVHIAYAKDDLSDLVDLCRFYLDNEAAREEMCLNSRRFFDEHLHKDNLTAYYLRSCLDLLPN